MSRGVMNRHTYDYDEVVVGNSLNAVLYSYLNTKPLVLNNQNKPLFFEFLPKEFDISKLNMEPVEYELQGLNSVKKVGSSKLEVWERLIFALSLSGLIPLSDKVASIRVDDTLKITTQNFKFAEIKFNKLRVFDDENIFGLGVPKKEVNRYKVVDWVNVRSGMLHSYDYFETSSNFVKELYFYPSMRIDGVSDKKDLVAVSYLEKEELNDFDYSDTIAKFKILKLMKKAGIRGARNGRDQDNPEKYKYYAVKIQPKKREIKKSSFNQYEDKENLIFDYRTVEEICNDIILPDTYCTRLNRQISKR